MTAPGDGDSVEAALAGVSSAFGSLGRILLCADRNFRILHAPGLLDEFLGPDATADCIGRPLEELLGVELFGPTGALRVPLLAGERREGWRATIGDERGKGRRFSVSAAPFCPLPGAACDPRVAYVVVLRAADEDLAAGGSAPTHFGGMVARSAAMTRIFRLIENLVQSEVTVILTGESGTGKEMVARAIHVHSPRHKGPFVAVNCGALPNELLESELFGHVKGAFTGAIRDRQGRFEMASGGTLFLDEVADLPLTLQVKLLRVLQDRTYQMVGESRTRVSDARIIAATNTNLQRAVVEGRFREDLYYRLKVVSIEVPPLHERREDIEPLAQTLLASVGARHGRAVRFSPGAIRAILEYPWPGNVRELENALEYAVAVCKGQTLQPEDLPAEVLQGVIPAREVSVPGLGPPGSGAADAEDLRKLLDAHHWHRATVARILGISRTTLWRRMREAGLAADET
jgi:DNA-binding NtrC family response regulator